MRRTTAISSPPPQGTTLEKQAAATKEHTRAILGHSDFASLILGLIVQILHLALRDMARSCSGMF
jgi:hypothetical protein